MKNIIIALAAILLLIAGAWFVLVRIEPPTATVVEEPILSFEDCEKAGYAIMESYPRQCRTADGRLYAEEIPVQATYVNATNDLIRIENPHPGAVTGKMFSVTGSARGTWYFEASFPVELIDAAGKSIATGIAQAQGEWMTEEFVPFQAVIEVPATFMGPATLILRKDNASGLPEHDASVSFPITVEY